MEAISALHSVGYAASATYYALFQVSSKIIHRSLRTNRITRAAALGDLIKEYCHKRLRGLREKHNKLGCTLEPRAVRICQVNDWSVYCSGAV